MKNILIYIFGVTAIMAIEKPEYKVIENYGKVEIREYKPMVIAKTNVHQNYGVALNEGFRRIANYIFGGNDKKMSIAMTAPVISQKLSTGFEEHEILFVMPKEYAISMLPQPILDHVKLEERSLNRVAVIQFGGWATQDRVADYQKKLETRINELNLSKIGNFMVAQYNSPWALPPFRHNEILVQIK
jgi:hypothetical protein